MFTVIVLALGIFETVLRLSGNAITRATIVLVALLLISGILFTLFALWFSRVSNNYSAPGSSNLALTRERGSRTPWS